MTKSTLIKDNQTTKRKYEFKEEKNKKKIVKIILSVLIVVFVIGLSINYLKEIVYIDSKNSNIEENTFNASTNIKTQSIKLNYRYIFTFPGKTKYLKVTVSPENSTDTITWKSLNPKVATVDSTGTVQILKTGVAVIKVKSGYKTDKAIIVVLKNNNDQNTTTSSNTSLFNKNKLSINFTVNTYSTVMNYKDVLKFNTTIKNTGNQDLYYQWIIYQGNDLVYKDSACSKVQKNTTISRIVDITMGGTDKHGEFISYSDSSCKTELETTKTATYTLDSDFAYMYNGVASTTKVGSSNIYTEKGVSTTLNNNLLYYFKDFYKKTPKLYHIKNAYILTPSSFNKKYDLSWSGKGSTGGMTKGGGYLSLSTISIFAPSSATSDRYTAKNRRVVSHELGHALNNKYYKNTGKYISKQSDIINLYNKYNSYSNKPLSSYAYNNSSEFWAECFAYYYDNVYYGSTNYIPSDIKQIVQQYIAKF